MSLLRRIVPEPIKLCINKNKKKIVHFKKYLSDPFPKILVLAYHRVLPEVRKNPLNTLVSLKTFSNQVDLLSRKFPIIKLSDAMDQCKSLVSRDKIQMVLTFDDGYRDNFEFVFPILRAKNISATFFLATNYIDSNMPIWDWEVISILSSDNETINSVNVGNEIIYRRNYESRLSFALRVMEGMKSLNNITREKSLLILRAKSKKEMELDYSGDMVMTWDQIKEMNDSGMEIGAHSLSHPSLSRIPFEDAVYEIRKSKETIEQNIKNECVHFAFPFGSDNDYNPALIKSAKEAGFMTCLLNVHGYNQIKKRDSFCFNRIIMEETTDIRYLLG